MTDYVIDRAGAFVKERSGNGILIRGGTGSVGDFTTGIDTRLSGYTGNALTIFSTKPPDTDDDDPPFATTPVYNTNLWGGGGVDFIEDMTAGGLIGVVWYTAQNTGTFPSAYGRGVAITPRHILTTQHGRHDDGNIVTWILADGSVVSRTVTHNVEFIGHEIAGYDSGGTFWMGYLDSDLEQDPMEADYVPITPLLDPSLHGTLNLHGQPVIKSSGNYNFGLLVAEIEEFSTVVGLRSPSDADQLNYYSPAIYGDSGSPVWAVYNDQMIYLTNLTRNTPYAGGSGPNALAFTDYLEAAVTTLNAVGGTSHEITYIDTDEPVVTPPTAATFDPGTDLRPLHTGISIGI